MKQKYLTLLSFTGVILCLDQATKLWIVDNYHLGESHPIISGFFNITYVRNPGAAFGIFADYPPQFRIPFFIIIPIVALIVIGILFYKLKDEQRLQATALAMILGGALGNFIDRIKLKYVIDFLDFYWGDKYHFPAFNVADSAITIGVGILMISLFKEARQDYLLAKAQDMAESSKEH